MVVVMTVDTDVVVILIGKLNDLLLQSPNQHTDLWVAFGMWRNFQLISINGFCSSLGESKARALPVFHALTGSDCTSQFYGIGKIAAWKAWEVNEQLTSILREMSTHPFQNLTISTVRLKCLERMAILMYARSSPLESVNEVRMTIFSKRSTMSLESIPPTQVGFYLSHLVTINSMYLLGLYSKLVYVQLQTHPFKSFLPHRIFHGHRLKMASGSQMCEMQMCKRNLVSAPLCKCFCLQK